MLLRLLLVALWGLLILLVVLRGLLCVLRTWGDAVALHLLVAQLRNDGGGYQLGDDVELSMPQTIVDDEAHQRFAVHDQALLHGFGAQVRFGFACKRRVIAEQTRVIIGVDEHRVERGRIFAASADHGFAPHLLLGFFGNLNGRDRRFRHFAGCTFEGVFHPVLELRENTHCYSFFTAFNELFLVYIVRCIIL